MNIFKTPKTAHVPRKHLIDLVEHYSLQALQDVEYPSGLMCGELGLTVEECVLPPKGSHGL